MSAIDQSIRPGVKLAKRASLARASGSEVHLENFVLGRNCWPEKKPEKARNSGFCEAIISLSLYPFVPPDFQEKCGRWNPFLPLGLEELAESQRHSAQKLIVP